MDAYAPITQSYIPSAYVWYTDLPWQPEVQTRSNRILLSDSRRERVRGASTSNRVPTDYTLVDSPALAGIERLRAFRDWPDNWDSEGSRAPDPATVDGAVRLFSLLSVYRAPQVTLTAEGHPMFVYAKPCSGEVIMTESGKFDYFFSDDDAPSDEDVAFDGLELPPALVDYISTYGA